MAIGHQEDTTLLEMQPLSQEEVEDVKLKILRTLLHFEIPYKDSDVDTLLQKCITQGNGETPAQRLEFAFVITRNWCRDRIRAARSRTNKAIEAIIRQRKEEETEALKSEEKIRFLQARDEYRTLVGKLIYEPIEIEEDEDALRAWRKMTTPQIGQLGMLYFTIFEQESDEELAGRYPDTQRDVRFQWRKRGRELVYPHASDNLRTFLDCKNLHNKHKKAHLMSL